MLFVPPNLTSPMATVLGALPALSNDPVTEFQVGAVSELCLPARALPASTMFCLNGFVTGSSRAFPVVVHPMAPKSGEDHGRGMLSAPLTSLNPKPITFLMVA